MNPQFNSTLTSPINGLYFSRPTAPYYQVVNVNPDIAKEWLSKSMGNRTPKKSRIIWYAQTMAQGNWRVSNDAICFDINGVLMNGHHRLHAIVMSGCEVSMLVGWGLAPDSMLVMDTGAPRKAGDVLSFRNVKDATRIASIVRQTLWYDNGGRQCMVSNEEIDKYYDKHAHALSDLCMRAYRPLCAAASSISTAEHVISRYHDQALVKHFFDVLKTGLPTDSNDKPIMLLRDILQKYRGNNMKAGTRIPQLQYTHKVIQIFGVWMRKEKIERVNMAVRGDMVNLYSAKTLRRVERTEP